MEQSHYGRLVAMAVLSFAAMYLLMYAMVDRLANIHFGLDQAYMAGLMAAPMVVIELLLMGMMYKNRRWNAKPPVKGPFSERNDRPRLTSR